MDSLQFVIIAHSEISTQKTLIFNKISVFICRKLVFLCLLFWSAYLRGGFHLELVHGFAGFRDVDVGRITVRHVVASPCLFSGNHLSISFTRSFSASAPIMNANSRREFQKKRGPCEKTLWRDTLYKWGCLMLSLSANLYVNFHYFHLLHVKIVV